MLDPDREEAHTGRLADQRPERPQVEASEDHPGRGTEDDAGGRDAVAPEERREDGGCEQEDAVQNQEVDGEGERTGDETDRVDGCGSGLAQQPPHQPLEGAVEAVGDPADLPTDVADQPDALRRDRRPDLGRLGDPLDQLLDLLRSEQPIPGMVDDVGIERPCRGPLDRPGWRASARATPGPLRTRAPGGSRARPPGSRAPARSPPRSRVSTAPSIPVAEATRSPARAPIPSIRAGSGRAPRCPFRA